jgi:tetratricopeptide (TPR) repeat protein
VTHPIAVVAREAAFCWPRVTATTDGDDALLPCRSRRIRPSITAMLRALVIIGLIGCGGGAVKEPAAPKHPETLAVMERYLAAPLDSAPGTLETIRDFVMKSSDVLVEIDELAVPFLDEDLDDGVKNLLMIGFVAGNAAAQLRAGTRGDQLVAGVEGELGVYRALKAIAATRLAHRKVLSPRLDALLELEASGQLRAHLERARVARRAGPAGASGAPVAAAPDGDLDATNAEGVRLVKSGRHAEAIAHFDQVIASHERRHAGEKRRIYCAHSPAESLLYMTESANQGQEAIALGPTWADALLAKSFALVELGRLADARATLEKALALAPMFTPYLSELGYLANRAKDWRRSLELYAAAEKHVALIADARVRVAAHTRALRGQGYALLELGDLAASERKYRESLALDPDDALSKQELDYIAGLKAKK